MKQLQAELRKSDDQQVGLHNHTLLAHICFATLHWHQ